MENATYYQDIEAGIDTYFSFLKEYGFAAFKQSRIAYEVHFTSKNAFVSVDVSFELSTSTHLWVTLDRYAIATLEPQNEVLERLDAMHKELYEALFNQYLETNKSVWLKRIDEQYAQFGKQLHHDYLAELAAILKRHASVLKGDKELFIANSQVLQQKIEAAKQAKRIADKVYTCRIATAGGLQGELEDTSLEGLREQLKRCSFASPTATIEVFDWHQQPLDFEL